MCSRLDGEGFKKLLVLFWTLWWIIALWTDIVGALAHFGGLVASWAPDTNFPFLVESLKMYHAPLWLAIVFFIGILAWSFVSTVTFIWASLSLCKPAAVWMRRAEIAYIVSLCFWLAFFLADQLVMKFDLEQNHMVQGGFQLLCYFGLYLVPARK